MARPVSETNEYAITIPESSKFTSRVTTYKSRIYFDTYIDDAPSFALPLGDTTGPLPEAFTYNVDMGIFVTVTIQSSVKIALLLEGNATPFIPTISGHPIVVNPGCRPGIYGNSIFYYSSGNWMKVVFDPALVLLGTADCILSQSILVARPNGAIYPLSNTEAIIFHMDEGGIRPIFIASDGSEHEHPGRLLNPTHIVQPSITTDVKSIHYSGAVKLNNTIFVYYTMYNGSVKVAKYKLATDGINGSWSDFFVAVPEDISVFEIGNVFVHDDRIFICGKFYRKEEFVTDTKYTLLLWSTDGVTFSIDRKTLVSALDLRFLAAISTENDLCFSSTNRSHCELAPYQVIGEDTDNTVIDLLTISGNPQNGWGVKSVGFDERYVDDPYMVPGSYAKLEIATYTSIGAEWIKYHDIVVSQIGKTFEDGIRGYEFQIVPDAVWHTSMMTHPFYLELQGKQTVLDQMQELDNLYKVEGNKIGILWTLTSDFWSKDIYASSDGGLSHRTHAGATTTDMWGPDIKEFCVDYPILGEAATILVRLYGWSRAGKPSLAPAVPVADTTPTDTLNDQFFALLLAEDPITKVQTTYVSTIGELASTYSNPPQTYFEEGARAGSYPIDYRMASPGVGKTLIKVGIRVISDTADTTFLPERAELPEITVIPILPDFYGNGGSEFVDSDGFGGDDGGDGGGDDGGDDGGGIVPDAGTVVQWIDPYGMVYTLNFDAETPEEVVWIWYNEGLSEDNIAYAHDVFLTPDGHVYVVGYTFGQEFIAVAPALGQPFTVLIDADWITAAYPNRLNVNAGGGLLGFDIVPNESNTYAFMAGYFEFTTNGRMDIYYNSLVPTQVMNGTTIQRNASGVISYINKHWVSIFQYQGWSFPKALIVQDAGPTIYETGGECSGGTPLLWRLGDSSTVLFRTRQNDPTYNLTDFGELATEWTINIDYRKTALASDPTGQSIMVAGIPPARAHDVYLSLDGGTTWIIVLIPENFPYECVLANGHTTDFWVAGKTLNAIWSSMDAGVTWEDRSGNLLPGGDAYLDPTGTTTYQIRVGSALVVV